MIETTPVEGGANDVLSKLSNHYNSKENVQPPLNVLAPTDSIGEFRNANEESSRLV